MSDHFIALIPQDPKARPGPDTLLALKTNLAAMCKTDEVRIKDYGQRLQFIDCGENLEDIRCPSCDTVVDIKWWGQRMDHAWDDEHGFHLCAFDMPCCRTSTRLDQLTYAFDQGFSTWFVSARNPGRGALTGEECARLEATAGLSLRVIYQMY